MVCVHYAAGADSGEPGSDAPAASAAPSEASRGWLRWLGLRRGRPPQREDSNTTAGGPPDHPEASSQSTAAQPVKSNTTQAASSRDLQPSLRDGQSGSQSTPSAAPEQDRRRQSSGTSTAHDSCAPERAGIEGYSGVLPVDAAGGPAPGTGQHRPAQTGSGRWWPPSLATWLLPGAGDPAGGPAEGSRQAAGQHKPAQQCSEGSIVRWPLNVVAWLLPGRTAPNGQASEHPPTEAAGSSPVYSTALREHIREPSQTPTHRRMSEGSHTCHHLVEEANPSVAVLVRTENSPECTCCCLHSGLLMRSVPAFADQARDAEHYKKWREERRKRASDTEAP